MLCFLFPGLDLLLPPLRRPILNILNTKRHFGYYYDAKGATWMQLSIPGYYGEKLETEWQSVENVIAVMYYTF